MRSLIPGLLLLIAMTAVPAHAQERIGEVDTTWRLASPDDRVVVERYDDPKVENASCYVSRAETGGWSGWVGLAEDPSRFSIACRATGPVRILEEIETGPEGELVFSERTSVLFKQMRVSRFLDEEKGVLVYLVWSTKLIDGSPYNSVTAIPLSEP
ncbi:CreA family protein [Rhodospirillaceae bacterium SYSU D60014]|uniref:CreA family protein n=1 Tax=Virgifigura deserti TaxID=2268457 RepID=UPI000E66E46D